MTTDSRTLLPAVASPRRLQLRHLWIVPGLVIAIYANAQATQLGVGIGTLLLFGIVPHLPTLLGLGQPHARGQMPGRAVPLFNVLRHPAPPLAVLVLAVAGVLSPFWLVVSLAWFSHIVIDLALDHGLRTSDGWRRSWWAPR